MIFWLQVIADVKEALSDSRHAVLSAAFASHISRNRKKIAAQWYENQFSRELLESFPNSYAEEASREDVTRNHLLPQLDLLAEYAQTGKPEYRDLYLGELRRYAPHVQGADTLRKYFATLLPRQESALSEGLPAELKDQVGQLHRPLIEARGRKVRVMVLGDCLLGDVQAFLGAMGTREGIDFDFRFSYFSAVMGNDLAGDEHLASTIRAGIDFVAISYLSYEGIPLYRSLLESADRGSSAELSALTTGITRFIREHLNKLRDLTDAPILLHNAAGLPLSRWRRRLPFLAPLSRQRRKALQAINAEIAQIAHDVENCVLIDEVAIAQRKGLRESARRILPRHIQQHASMHPEYFGCDLAGEYMHVLRDMSILKKTKVLLVDFDNTLWDGVMAEGPVLHDTQRQQLLKKLSEQGILLAAVSKNDPGNIRWSEMVLRESDFVSLKISWNLKVQSIAEIADELNLGRDACVLLDDNSAELEMVRTRLPEVVCLNSTEPATWRAIERLFQMPNTKTTGEAKRRTEMYKEQARRDAEVRDSSNDYPALMQTLSLRAAVGAATPRDTERLVELFQRTNQFNTTTIRYSRGEIHAMMDAPDQDLLVVELADKFGDLGIICTAVVSRKNGDAVIESLVMSCRAMGFGVEQLLLSFIAEANKNVPVTGNFVPTARNDPASSLYPNAGFTESSSGVWRTPLGHTLPAPSWIKIQHR